MAGVAAPARPGGRRLRTVGADSAPPASGAYDRARGVRKAGNGVGRDHPVSHGADRLRPEDRAIPHPCTPARSSSGGRNGSRAFSCRNLPSRRAAGGRPEQGGITSATRSFRRSIRSAEDEGDAVVQAAEKAGRSPDSFVYRDAARSAADDRYPCGGPMPKPGRVHQAGLSSMQAAWPGIRNLLPENRESGRRVVADAESGALMEADTGLRRLRPCT